MTPENDYTEELEYLENLERDLRVLRTLEAPDQEIRDLCKQINFVRDGIARKTE
jgi:hypothetical protein